MISYRCYRKCIGITKQIYTSTEHYRSQDAVGFNRQKKKITNVCIVDKCVILRRHFRNLWNITCRLVITIEQFTAGHNILDFHVICVYINIIFIGEYKTKTVSNLTARFYINEHKRTRTCNIIIRYYFVA